MGYPARADDASDRDRSTATVEEALATATIGDASDAGRDASNVHAVDVVAKDREPGHGGWRLYVVTPRTDPRCDVGLTEGPGHMPISQSPVCVGSPSAWESFVAWHGGGGDGSALAPSSDFSCAAETRSSHHRHARADLMEPASFGPLLERCAAQFEACAPAARRARGWPSLRPLRDAMRDAVRDVRSRNETAWSRTVRERVTRALRVLPVHLAGLQRGGVDRGVAACWDAATILSMSAAQPASSSDRAPLRGVAKTRFDAGQLAFLSDLAARGELTTTPDSTRAELRSHRGLAAYLRATAAEAAALEAGPLARELARARAEGREGALARTRADVDALHYVRPPQLHSAAAPADGSPLSEAARRVLSGGGVDVALTPAELERRGLLVIDDVLRPDVLEELYDYCVQSTVWFMVKRSYVGAYFQYGFSHPLLFDIADALRASAPALFEGFRGDLMQVWAYSHDNAPTADGGGDDDGGDRGGGGANASEHLARTNGIGLHRDSAFVVNVNLWLTPDSANLEPSRGGLVIFKKRDTDQDPLRGQDPEAGRAFLGNDNDSVYVPYRRNRAIVFDSTLWHKSDAPFRFRRGHANRRINLSLFFGLRARVEAAVAATDGSDHDDKELRIDPGDGNAYPRSSFVEEYGGTAEWDAAPPFTPEAAEYGAGRPRPLLVLDATHGDRLDPYLTKHRVELTIDGTPIRLEFDTATDLVAAAAGFVADAPALSAIGAESIANLMELKLQNDSIAVMSTS